MPTGSPSTIPVVAQYVTTFLKPEMLHIYRQIRALRSFAPVVFCQKRENPADFPFDKIVVQPKPRTHQLRRLWQKQILGRPITMYRREARRMISALRAQNAELLHIYFGHVGVYSLPLIEISPIPVIVSFHGADGGVDLEKPAHLDATRKMLSAASGILARSESLATQLVALGCRPEKLHIHRTGLPFEEFTFSQRAAPADGAWHCLQACRLIAKKGLAASLRAFAAFQKKFPRASLTIAGEGPLREELKALAESLGVADRVFFTGFVSQAKLQALYSEAHLFLHPSETSADGDREGVPNSMLEAMASGVPSLATRHGGIPEAVEHGVSGLLVAEGDAEALAGEMVALAENPERYAALSAAAAERVRRQFDLQEQTHGLEEIYRKTISAARAQAAVGSASKAHTSSSVV